MKWSDVGELVGKAAPLVGTVIGGPAGGAIGAIVAQALGTEATPEAVSTALAADPDAVLKLKEVESNNSVRFQELAFQHAGNVLQADTNRQMQTNLTMRAEYASTDPYVRRWRPTWGYATAATWSLEALGIFIAIVAGLFDPVGGPAYLTALAGLMTSLIPHWATALAVMGINVSSRSKDKQVAAGQEPPAGILGAIAARIAGGAK